MDIIRGSEKRTIRAAKTTVIHEYDTRDAFISGATAEINGRYPEKGYVVNKTHKELVYVISGQGAYLTPEGITHIAEGDVIFVDHGDVYAWEGSMTFFMTTAPRFDPEQHILID